MKRILLTFVLTSIFSSSYSSNPYKFRRNTTQQAIEINATTFLLLNCVDLSYERMYSINRNHKIGFSGGVGYIGLFGLVDSWNLWGIPLTFNYNLGGRNGHYFETKIGVQISPIIKDEFKGPWKMTKLNEEYIGLLYPIVSLSYRHQSPRRKDYIRISVSSKGVGGGIGYILGN